MEKEISVKNSKTEIIDAYTELLEKVKKQNSSNTNVQFEKEELKKNVICVNLRNLWQKKY